MSHLSCMVYNTGCWLQMILLTALKFLVLFYRSQGKSDRDKASSATLTNLHSSHLLWLPLLNSLANICVSKIMYVCGIVIILMGMCLYH